LALEPVYGALSWGHGQANHPNQLKSSHSRDFSGRRKETGQPTM